MSKIIWAYGMTTVVERINSGLTSRTLESLKGAGFPDPWVFCDNAGIHSHESVKVALGVSNATCRSVGIRTYGNWILGMIELYIRNPNAHRYAMFQDDFLACRNIRPFLEEIPYPPKGYLNLYTFPSNESLYLSQERGWKKARYLNDDPREPRLQTGRSALALVFSNDALITLLSAQSMIMKPKAADEKVKWKKVDGAIVTAMNLAGYSEYVHKPTLTLHTGKRSVMGNRRHPTPTTFPGITFDAMDLLREWDYGNGWEK